MPETPRPDNPDEAIDLAVENHTMKKAIRLYLNEYDNPMQDLTMKRQRLNELRRLVR